jgi:hypothetical protein
MSDNVTEHVRTLLSNAVEVLEEQGWTQHHLINAQDEVCTLGALGVAKRMGYLTNPTVDWGSVENKAVRLVGDELAGVLNGAPWSSEKAVSIPNMNDSAGTTQEDVMMSLKRALHSLDEDEEK